ncbi:conserved hypothetical protein [Serratia proteamaculans]|uniref:major capsid protein n=1 Tax=Serratia proteamaculans TaxID=28151 RepID=UPI0009F801C2|nr:major capsid protein [Serratia proteamaculans]SMB37089.1 conserved hypothetical protein [Serratia proteamaculans]
MSTIYGYGVIDLAPLFEVSPVNNFLLQAINIFDYDTSDTPKVELDRILTDNATLMNDNVKRYGSEHNTTQLDKATGYLVEIPHFARIDQISAQDFQGRKATRENREATLMDISEEYVRKHKLAHSRTTEAYLANCLFNARVNSPKTDDQIIDYSTQFGTAQKVESLALSDASLDVMKAFDGFVNTIAAESESLVSSVRRYVLFAGASMFSKIRFHASMKSAFQYVSPLDAGNVVFNVREVLPNVQSFTIPGTNIDVVKVADPILSAYIGVDEGILLPIFVEGTNAYQRIAGPASRDMDLALGDTSEYYMTMHKDAKWNDISIRFEAGLLPVTHAFNLSMKITAE